MPFIRLQFDPQGRLEACVMIDHETETFRVVVKKPYDAHKGLGCHYSNLPVGTQLRDTMVYKNWVIINCVVYTVEGVEVTTLRGECSISTVQPIEAPLMLREFENELILYNLDFLRFVYVRHDLFLHDAKATSGGFVQINHRIGTRDVKDFFAKERTHLTCLLGVLPMDALNEVWRIIYTRSTSNTPLVLQSARVRPHRKLVLDRNKVSLP